MLFLLFTVATASLHGRRGTYDYPLKGTPPQIALCNLIFEFFEDNKVKTFGDFLDKNPDNNVNRIIHRNFGLYEKRGEELIDAGSTSFRKLLAKEKNLYSLFARHMGGDCPFVDSLLTSMLDIAKGSSKRISILGFIYRLGDIYAETQTMPPKTRIPTLIISICSWITLWGTKSNQNGCIFFTH